eukprot:CAMPEP_0196588094 /NCGR_PEP_ID=MMETSP1081-20130531/59559_1 /TAXON_ID=36882 /ORGANISM="Pyramimonas amylifera, Strain CCMP720" /LENGTH=518 /DNA_ID=CAMNT_0041910499 /DNA_START=348 /DNA_END=1904 /DNA_ORIENTATION=+
MTRGRPRAGDLDYERGCSRMGESRRGSRSTSLGPDLKTEVQGAFSSVGITPVRLLDDIHGFNPPPNAERGRGSIEADIFGRSVISRSKNEIVDENPVRNSTHQLPSVKKLRSRNAPRASRNGRLPPGGELTPMQTSSRVGSLVSRDMAPEPFWSSNRAISQRHQHHVEVGVCKGDHCNTLSFPDGLHAFEDDAMKYDPVIHEPLQHPFGNNQELLVMWRRGVLQGGLNGGGELRVPASLIPAATQISLSSKPTWSVKVASVNNEWRRFSSEDSARIEQAAEAGLESLQIGSKHVVNLQTMCQYKVGDPLRAKPIKREAALGPSSQTPASLEDINTQDTFGVVGSHASRSATLAPLPALPATTSSSNQNGLSSEGASVPVCRDCFRVYMFREAQRLLPRQHNTLPQLQQHQHLLQHLGPQTQAPKHQSSPLHTLNQDSVLKAPHHIDFPVQTNLDLTKALPDTVSLSPLITPLKDSLTPIVRPNDDSNAGCTDEATPNCRQGCIQDPSENTSRELLCTR